MNLTGIDFAASDDWESYITDLGTADYSDLSTWEVVTAPVLSTFTTLDGSQTLSTNQTVKLADNYANGGLAGHTYRLHCSSDAGLSVNGYGCGC